MPFSLRTLDGAEHAIAARHSSWRAPVLCKSVRVFASTGCDPALMVGTFYGDSKTRPSATFGPDPGCPLFKLGLNDEPLHHQPGRNRPACRRHAPASLECFHRLLRALYVPPCYPWPEGVERNPAHPGRTRPPISGVVLGISTDSLGSQLRPDRFGNLVRRQLRRQEAAIASVRTEHIDEARVIDRVIVRVAAR
jgi:hypothetical protein